MKVGWVPPPPSNLTTGACDERSRERLGHVLLQMVIHFPSCLLEILTTNRKAHFFFFNFFNVFSVFCFLQCVLAGRIYLSLLDVVAKTQSKLSG